ncbi:MAG: alpha/beta hydrolase [Gammaproteobacteria bacterium]
MGYLSDTVETRRVEGRFSTYAYRDFGVASAAPPLVLLTRFKATMDHWDPAFLDALAAERRVIVFDNAGVSESTGEVPASFALAAEGVVDFVGALKLGEVDLLGWSIGGFAGQMVALNHPGVARRLLVLGSGPGGVPGTPQMDPRVLELMVAPENGDEDYLFLFFGHNEDGRQAGLKSLRRLDFRLSRSRAAITPEAWGRQLEAIQKWAPGNGSAWSRLEEIKIPVLVANGAHDVMVRSEDSFAMVKRMTNATAVLYGDSGHAFLFQHPEKFGKVALEFLR